MKPFLVGRFGHASIGGAVTRRYADQQRTGRLCQYLLRRGLAPTLAIACGQAMRAGLPAAATEPAAQTEEFDRYR